MLMREHVAIGARGSPLRSMPVTIRHLASADELLQLNLRMLEERLGPRFLWRDGTLLVAVAAGGLAVLALGHWRALHRVSFGLAIAGLSIAFFPRVRPAGLRRRLMAMAARQQAAGITVEIEVAIEAKGVVSRGGRQERRIAWDAAAACERDDEAVRLIGRDGEVITIPWRAVPEPDRRAALESLLSDRGVHEDITPT